MATKKFTKTFAVKLQTLELNDNQEDGKTLMSHTETISLGEKLNQNEAVELRKANKGSYIHPENRVYKSASKHVVILLMLKFFAMLRKQLTVTEFIRIIMATLMVQMLDSCRLFLCQLLISA